MTGDDVNNINDPLMGNSTLDVPESTDIKPEEEVKVKQGYLIYKVELISSESENLSVYIRNSLFSFIFR